MFNDKEKALVEEVVHRMVKNAVEMEGTVTGEHGIGLVKRDYLPHELGETTVDAMRRVIIPSSPFLPFLECLFLLTCCLVENCIRSAVSSQLR